MEQIKKLFEEINENCTFGEISSSGIYFSIPVKVDTSNIDLDKLQEEVDNLDERNLISSFNDMEGYELSNKIDKLPVSEELLEELIKDAIDHEEDELDGNEEIIEQLNEIRDQGISTVIEFLTAVWEIYDGFQSMSSHLGIEEIEEEVITFEYGEGN